MDLIERWLGISPDGGDGSLEGVYLLAIVVILAAIIFRARIQGIIRRRF